MRANLSNVLTELADFTGFDIANDKIEVRKLETIVQQEEGLWEKAPQVIET